MKRPGCISLLLGCTAFLLIAALPACAAPKKITVKELSDLLASMHQANKSDADVAAALKQITVSEELTRAVMNALAGDVPGPLSTEQLYVLEARSAMLPPPPSDIPANPAPDSAAILAKTDTYVNGAYAQLPALTATKTSLRFQDNVEVIAQSSGLHSSASDVSVGSGFVNAPQFVHYINSTDVNIATNHGQESLPPDKTRWGANKMIAITEPDPSLARVYADAKDSGSLKFVRWETINGKPAAVFSFEVAKKKAHLALNVCCFPTVDQAGDIHFSSASVSSANGGGAGGAKGNFQTTTDFHPYKPNGFGYHGELFVDPDSGIVVRMIVQDELKNTDVVHVVDTRVDYGPTPVGDKSLVLPVRTVVATEVVPNGDSGAGGVSIRNTFFTSEYKNYAPAGGTAQK